MQLLNSNKARLCLSFFALSCASLFGQIYTPFACGQPDSTVVDSSLVAWWPLNGPGATAPLNTYVPDCSGNGLTATWETSGNWSWYANSSSFYESSTVVSGLGYFVFNNQGQASNTHDWVQLPTGINVSNAFTISAWAKADMWPEGQTPLPTTVSVGGGATIVAIGEPGTNTIFLGQNNTTFASQAGSWTHAGSYQFIVNNANQSTNYGSCIGGTIDGQLHLVTGVFDGENGYLYVDGVQVAGPCAGFVMPAGGLINQSGRVGAYFSANAPNSNNGVWYGGVGGVRLYDRVLSQSEILEIFNSKAL